MFLARCCTLLLLFASANSVAQLPDEKWDLEDAYRMDLLYVHALANYAWDGDWQFDWQRRQFADNSLRINTGSVSSSQLLTEVDLNINQDLGRDFRFFGRYNREGFRRRPLRSDLLLLGLEWLPFESSGFYLAANPEFDKEFIDVAFGYTLYRENREQYLRVGVLAEDINWGSKNKVGGEQQQKAYKFEWTLRWPLVDEWWLYSAGRWGTGYERTYGESSTTPDLASQDRDVNEAEFRAMRRVGERLWSFSAEVYEYDELSTFRTPGFDFEYENRQLNVGVEHIRVFRDKHRLRLLAQYVDQQAKAAGFRAHDFSRTDVVGGIFYERLRPNSSWTFAYAFGQPDIDYRALGGQPSYRQDDYSDKIIAGWEYDFSDDAQIRLTISHEVSEKGFGGGAVQYQMFF